MTGSIKLGFEKTPLMYNKPVMLNLFQQLQSLAKQAAYPNKILKTKILKRLRFCLKSLSGK